MIRTVRVAKEATVTIAAIFGALCITGLVAGMFFGVTTLVFRSGSMAPAIQTGALALAQEVPAADIRVGDIVSAVNAHGTRITHRVVAIESRGGGTYAMTMRGDANTVADPSDYLVSRADRILWHVDGLGYVAQWVQKPGVMFVGGILAGALLVSSVVLRSAPGEGVASDKRSKSRSSAAASVALAVALGVPLLAAHLTAAKPTWAAFVDTATASSSFSTLTTAQLRPVFNGCSEASGVLTVAWSDPSGGVPDRGYTVQSGSSSAEIAAASSPYHWSTPLVAGDLITITARHFASWSASIQVRVTIATDGSIVCSQV